MARFHAWILVGMLAFPPLYAEGFWSAREIAEIDGFSELDGVVKLKFKDAVSAKPIAGLQVTIDTLGTFSGSPDGIVQFPLERIADLTDETLAFLVTAPGYIAYEDTLKVRLGTLFTKRFVLSPVLPPQQARMVLEWGKRPSDVDASLVGPGFTVSYRSMKGAKGNATLDQDSRSGYGPETITLLNIKPNAEYVFSVQNFSKDAPLDGVKVAFYVNNKLDKVVFLARSSATKLEIARIRNGAVEYLAR